MLCALQYMEYTTPNLSIGCTVGKVIIGGSLTVFPKFSRPSWTNMSEISINTVENIDEIDQIVLLTTCTTKLHRYYRVTLHFWIFTNQNFGKFHHTPSFITFARVCFTKTLVTWEILFVYCTAAGWYNSPRQQCLWLITLHISTPYLSYWLLDWM